MNTNYAIIKLTWSSEDQDAAFVSFYITTKEKSAIFFANPETLKSSLDAMEVYCISQSEYLKNQVQHNSNIRAFVALVSVRFEEQRSQPIVPQKILMFSQEKPAPASLKADTPSLIRKNSKNCNVETSGTIRTETTQLDNPTRTPPRNPRRNSMEYSPNKRAKPTFEKPT